MNKRVGLIGVAAILSVSAWFVSGSGVHAFSGQSASVERRSSSPNAHSSGQREATAQGNSSKADSRTRPDNGNGDKDGSHPSGSKQEVRVVRGSFVNEVLICSGEPQQTSDPITFHATCKIGSLYTGGFTGHTIGKLDGTYDVNGDAKGTYDE